MKVSSAVPRAMKLQRPTSADGGPPAPLFTCEMEFTRPHTGWPGNGVYPPTRLTLRFEGAFVLRDFERGTTANIFG